MTVMKDIGDIAKGEGIIKSVLEKPLRTIVANAGYNSNEIVNKLFSQLNELGFGFDARRGEYANMFQEGIIDPLKVVKTALINAVSVASLILTTEAVVTDLPEEKESKMPMGGGGGMPGMGDY